MLNISSNRVQIDRADFPALQKVEERKSGKLLVALLISMLFIVVVSLFLPWTQNIRSQGSVTSLLPNERPQSVHSVIAGRIEAWYVQEGDFVAKGDTIAFLSEVKDKYFDPHLLERTQERIDAKQSTISSYLGKVGALQDQMGILEEARDIKIEQGKNKLASASFKLVSDSMDLEAAKLNFSIADQQYARMQKMFEQGLKSRTEMEKRELTLQKTAAELVAKENKLLSSRNEVENARVELASIKVQYAKDLAKAQSDQFSAQSEQFNAEESVAKMSNELMNYSIRSRHYFITAPQDGYITRTIHTGIGETVKDGAEMVTIMPAQYDLAVEMYVRPLDLPLIKPGQEVRILFDGWPAIVFSGWPNTTYGTFGGLVSSIDNFADKDGMYRVLVSSDSDAEPWPDALRVGSGAMNLILLKEVPIWYEIWRQLNGFPPDYYTGGGKKVQNSKAH